jgi:hypothetical protein
VREKHCWLAASQPNEAMSVVAMILLVRHFYYSRVTYYHSASINSQALFTSHPNLKYFLFHPSHQIFRRMNRALNVGKKDN